MPQTVVTIINDGSVEQVVTVSDNEIITISVPDTPYVQIFDVGIMNYSGVNKEFTYFATGGETQITVTNIGIARDLTIQQGPFILSEYKGAGTVPPISFKRSGNTLYFGDALARTERVLIKSSTTLS